jgi:hypothetical protein
MKRHIYLFAICLLVFACSKVPSPVQVTAPIEFGGYEIQPPQGYWYFPKQLPADFRKKEDYFAVMTFASNKEDMPSKNKKMSAHFLFFNFGIAENKYKSFEDYYNAAKQAGVHYNDLPTEAEVLNEIPNWSCKQPEVSYTTIECNCLKDDILSIYVTGSDKAEVFSTTPQLKQMIESVRVNKR